MRFIKAPILCNIRVPLGLLIILICQERFALSKEIRKSSAEKIGNLGLGKLDKTNTTTTASSTTAGSIDREVVDDDDNSAQNNQIDVTKQKTYPFLKSSTERLNEFEMIDKTQKSKKKRKNKKLPGCKGGFSSAENRLPCVNYSSYFKQNELLRQEFENNPSTLEVLPTPSDPLEGIPFPTRIDPSQPQEEGNPPSYDYQFNNNDNEVQGDYDYDLSTNPSFNSFENGDDDNEAGNLGSEVFETQTPFQYESDFNGELWSQYDYGLDDQ